MKKAENTKQQARSAQSQLAVIESVVALIAEKGFSNATTANIAKNAGVSWGVLQYQFGGKDQIFAAVLQSSLHDLMAALRDATVPIELPLEQKFIAAIDAIWVYYSAPTYRASTEIMLNYSHKSEDFLKIARHSNAALIKFISAILRQSGLQLPRKQAQSIAEIMLAALRGFALANATFPQRRWHFKNERDTLAKFIASSALHFG